MANQFGITLATVQNELAQRVRVAHHFITSEYTVGWEAAENYYNGLSDLPTEEGRSQVVKTEVRDIIRSLMPNIMRVLLQARKPVQYEPYSIMTAAFAEQQEQWAKQLFWSNGGYKMLYDATLQALKLKASPVKVTWDDDPEPEFISVSNITIDEVEQYKQNEDFVVDTVEPVEADDLPANENIGEQLYDMTGTRYYTNGRIRMEAFPIYEFFVEREATNLSDYVHGHRRSVTVGEAIEMGLDYADWRGLDDNDPKVNEEAEVEQAKRQTAQRMDERDSEDLMLHRFLLSETYCKYDLDGDGIAERYVFYFGGTSYTYLHHERIEDIEISIIAPDPIPFSVIGHSVYDVVKQGQDVETSILRAIVDNAHIANNPRPAADPTRVNFDDLMNNAIGAPVRVKGNTTIQYTDVPATAQGLTPFLQYLEQMTQDQVGVTKASTGLDPDALQSTDKNAVMNTIQLGQGQVELLVRNIIETGLVPMFRTLLRLSMRHMDRIQLIRMKGEFVPVDISRFDPNLVALPGAGLGTASREQRIAILNWVYGEQKQYMAQFGMDNPFTSLSQVYNTLEDLIELGGLTNAGRYFNHIDKTVEAAIGQQMAQAQAQQAQQAQQNQPMDPSKALIMSESMRARTKKLELLMSSRNKQLELQHDALYKAEMLDIQRDTMIQNRVIQLATIGKDQDNAIIQREQQADNATEEGLSISSPAAKSSG